MINYVPLTLYALTLYAAVNILMDSQETTRPTVLKHPDSHSSDRETPSGSGVQSFRGHNFFPRPLNRNLRQLFDRARGSAADARNRSVETYQVVEGSLHQTQIPKSKPVPRSPATVAAQKSFREFLRFE